MSRRILISLHKITLVFVTALLLPSVVKGADAGAVPDAKSNLERVQVDTIRQNSQFGFSRVVHTSVYSPHPSEVPMGQYSGITYLGGTRYAVVDDKLPGCGLVFLDIVIDDSGEIFSVKATMPLSVQTAQRKDRDNEGVAFFRHKVQRVSGKDTVFNDNTELNVKPDSLLLKPVQDSLSVEIPQDSLAAGPMQDTLSKNTAGDTLDIVNLSDSVSVVLPYSQVDSSFRETLFISSENGQAIDEYDLEGNPTGRFLQIPLEMKADKIYPNNGFEALTYNDSTGLFWVTTETPLRADNTSDYVKNNGLEGLLVRLQSFNSDLLPCKQFFYQMDKPLKSSAEASQAKAYVHGISAMTALDDGSLLVLEREVYVPNGGLFKMALKSFSRSHIYIIRPEGEELESFQKKPGDVKPLEKRLLTSFATAAANLANYEGMCLGPDLPGGWHTLVLIADSQGGQGGLTQEYLKVIAFQ